MTGEPAEVRWWKWGDGIRTFRLEDVPRFRKFLEERWNTPLKEDFTPPSVATAVSFSAVTAARVRELFPDLPEECVACDALTRLRNGTGKSYHDIIRYFTGSSQTHPDGVLLPRSEEDILYILRRASETGTGLIPFSGGTNVTGAIAAPEPSPGRIILALNLRHLNRMTELDADSCTATFEGGITGPELEKQLNGKGFTLGHFPQSFEYSTLGGWLATRSAGQESGLYGKIEDMVLGLRAATPAGIFSHADFPRHAAGIDLHPLFLGSEGTLGIITQAKMKIRPLCKEHRWAVQLFSDFESACAMVKEMLHRGIEAALVRASDAEETRLQFLFRESDEGMIRSTAKRFMLSSLRGKGFSAPCMLMLRFPARHAADHAAVREVTRMAGKRGAVNLPPTVTGAWENTRFSMPYMRDTLIQHRILIDTFETAAYWSNLLPLYHGIASALDATGFKAKGGILLCHLSHAYLTGASLYFTLIAQQERGRELEQWEELKKCVTDAVVANGGAISHHHGIGKDHRPWYLQGLTDTQRGILKTLKGHLDPRGILNPEKLFDERKEKVADEL